MSKRKKPSIKRTRRSPYERSLDFATKRLAKATEEHKDCQLRLEALNKEIPYLQTVIRALTPRNDGAVLDGPPRRLADGRWGRAPWPTIMADIPPATAPPTINVDELPSEEDQFLNVTVPGEKELLP